MSLSISPSLSHSLFLPHSHTLYFSVSLFVSIPILPPAPCVSLSLFNFPPFPYVSAYMAMSVKNSSWKQPRLFSRRVQSELTMFSMWLLARAVSQEYGARSEHFFLNTHLVLNFPLSMRSIRHKRAISDSNCCSATCAKNCRSHFFKNK